MSIWGRSRDSFRPRTKTTFQRQFSKFPPRAVSSCGCARQRLLQLLLEEQLHHSLSSCFAASTPKLSWWLTSGFVPLGSKEGVFITRTWRLASGANLAKTLIWIPITQNWRKNTMQDSVSSVSELKLFLDHLGQNDILHMHRQPIL